MAEDTNWVAVAIDQLGGPSEAVRKLWDKDVRVSASGLFQMRNRGKVVDLEVALAFSELTGISPWRLAGRVEPPLEPTGTDPGERSGAHKSEKPVDRAVDGEHSRRGCGLGDLAEGLRAT